MWKIFAGILTAVAALCAVFWIGYKIAELADSKEPLQGVSSNSNIKRHHSSMNFLTIDGSKPNFNSLLKEAKKNVLLHATSFSFTTESREKRQAILDAVRRGVNVSFFALNPKLDIISAIAKSAGYGEKWWRQKQEESTSRLIELYELYKNDEAKYQGKLEIYFYDIMPHGLLFIFDPSIDKLSKAYHVPYIPLKSSRDSPAFIIEDNSVIKEYWNALKNLEKSSKKISEIYNLE